MPRDTKDLRRLLKEFEELPPHGGLVLAYAHEQLVGDLFAEHYGGWDLKKTITKSKARTFRTGGSVGLSSGLLQLFADLKASIGAEARYERKAGIEATWVPELALTVALCDARLRKDGLVAENPKNLGGKGYLRLVNLLTTFVHMDDPKLKEAVGVEVADVMVGQWKTDQEMTRGKKQLLLASPKPSPVAAIIMVDADLPGSTYLSYPVESGKQRVVFATPLPQEEGVTFLKTIAVFEEKTAGPHVAG